MVTDRFEQDDENMGTSVTTGDTWHLRHVGTPATIDKSSLLIRLSDDGQVTVGRGPKADFFLDSNIYVRLISRIHAVIVGEKLSNGYLKFTLINKGLNGTYINDFKLGITERNTKILQEGDKVAFGHINCGSIGVGEYAPQPHSEFQFVFERVKCLNTSSLSQYDPSKVNPYFSPYATKTPVYSNAESFHHQDAAEEFDIQLLSPNSHDMASEKENKSSTASVLEEIGFSENCKTPSLSSATSHCQTVPIQSVEIEGFADPYNVQHGYPKHERKERLDQNVPKLAKIKCEAADSNVIQKSLNNGDGIHSCRSTSPCSDSDHSSNDRLKPSGDENVNMRKDCFSSQIKVENVTSLASWHDLDSVNKSCEYVKNDFKTVDMTGECSTILLEVSKNNKVRNGEECDMNNDNKLDGDRIIHNPTTTCSTLKRKCKVDLSTSSKKLRSSSPVVVIEKMPDNLDGKFWTHLKSKENISKLKHHHYNFDHQVHVKQSTSCTMPSSHHSHSHQKVSKSHFHDSGNLSKHTRKKLLQDRYEKPPKSKGGSSHDIDPEFVMGLNNLSVASDSGSTEASPDRPMDQNDTPLSSPDCLKTIPSTSSPFLFSSPTSNATMSSSAATTDEKCSQTSSPIFSKTPDNTKLTDFSSGNKEKETNITSDVTKQIHSLPKDRVLDEQKRKQKEVEKLTSSENRYVSNHAIPDLATEVSGKKKIGNSGKLKENSQICEATIAVDGKMDNSHTNKSVTSQECQHKSKGSRNALRTDKRQSSPPTVTSTSSSLSPSASAVVSHMSSASKSTDKGLTKNDTTKMDTISKIEKSASQKNVLSSSSKSKKVSTNLSSCKRDESQSVNSKEGKKSEQLDFEGLSSESSSKSQKDMSSSLKDDTEKPETKTESHHLSASERAKIEIKTSLGTSDSLKTFSGLSKQSSTDGLWYENHHHSQNVSSQVFNGSKSSAKKRKRSTRTELCLQDFNNAFQTSVESDHVSTPLSYDPSLQTSTTKKEATNVKENSGECTFSEKGQASSKDKSSAVKIFKRTDSAKNASPKISQSVSSITSLSSELPPVSSSSCTSSLSPFDIYLQSLSTSDQDPKVKKTQNKSVKKATNAPSTSKTNQDSVKNIKMKSKKRVKNALLSSSKSCTISSALKNKDETSSKTKMMQPHMSPVEDKPQKDGSRSQEQSSSNSSKEALKKRQAVQESTRDKSDRQASLRKRTTHSVQNNGEKEKTKFTRRKRRPKRSKILDNLDSDDTGERDEDDLDDEDSWNLDDGVHYCDTLCNAECCSNPVGRKVDWVMCDQCDGWYHVVCVNTSIEKIQKEGGQFYCGLC